MLFKELRRICFYYSNEKDLKVELGLSVNSEKFVNKACELLLKTNFLSDETKLYLKEPSLNYEDVSAILGINYHTLKSRLRGENIKINKLLGKNLDNIFSGKDITDSELISAISIIEYQIKKHGTSRENINELLMLPIQRAPFSNETNIDDEAFNILCKELLDLSLAFAKVKEETMPISLKAYFNKLNFCEDLNEIDISRREKLLKTLKRKS